jgi:hypothetical protein
MRLWLAGSQFQYETDTRSWTMLAAMPSAATYATDMAWFGGLLVMVGGAVDSASCPLLFATRLQGKGSSPLACHLLAPRLLGIDAPPRALCWMCCSRVYPDSLNGYTNAIFVLSYVSRRARGSGVAHTLTPAPAVGFP